MFDLILSLPKSFYVSCRLLGFRNAFRLPCMVHHRCKVRSLGGSLAVDGPIRRGILSIGFGNVSIFDARTDRSIIEIDGRMEIEGQTNFGTSARISVGRNGHLRIGRNFVNTAAATVVCHSDITIGRDVLVSWNTLIMDTDFHEVRDVAIGAVSSKSGRIAVGDNVWIGTGAMLLKGTDVPDGCIIGAMSLVNKKFDERDCMLAGTPAQVKKHGVTLNR